MLGNCFKSPSPPEEVETEREKEPHEKSIPSRKGSDSTQKLPDDVTFCAIEGIQHIENRRQDNRVFTLADGSLLGFAVYGDLSSHAPTVFYFHGLGSSRLEGKPWSKVAANLNIRIVAVDRPGIGLSSPQPDRYLLDWPPQILELAEYLDVEQFWVLGASAGAVYAIACAKSIPKSVLRGVGIMGALGPYPLGLDLLDPGIKGMLNGIKKAPQAMQLMTSILGWHAGARNSDSQQFKRTKRKELRMKPPGPDKAVFASEENFNAMAEAFKENYKQGSKGMIEDGKLLIEDWDFELEDLDFDGIKLWYGELDQTTPPALGTQIETRIKGSTMTILTGEGHLSVLFNCCEQILRDFVKN